MPRASLIPPAAGRRTGLGLTLTALVGMSGCTAGPPAKSLEGYCQIRPCTCVEADVPFLVAPETVPPQWTAEGDATCPPGFRLRADLED